MFDREARRMLRTENRKNRKSKAPFESIISGAAFALIFGSLWFFRGDWWWAFPFFFAGVMPLIVGFRKLFTQRILNKESVKQLELECEKQILRAALENNGRLTPAMAALTTNLSIADAQKVLETMTKNGHAAMRITSSGTIEFEFTEFLKEKDDVKHLL